jgi:hypothetical protein
VYHGGRRLEAVVRERNEKIADLIADTEWVVEQMDLGFAIAIQNYKQFLKALSEVKSQAKAATFVNQYFRSHMLPSMLEALAWNFWRYRTNAHPGALDNYVPNYPTVKYSPISTAGLDNV